MAETPSASSSSLIESWATLPDKNVIEFWRVNSVTDVTISHQRLTRHPDRSGYEWHIELEGEGGWSPTGWAGADWVETTLKRENVLGTEREARAYARELLRKRIYIHKQRLAEIEAQLVEMGG